MTDQQPEDRRATDRVPLRQYVDAQLGDLRRALDRAVDGVPLREHVEAILQEQRKAVEMAEREREKAALALREQQQEGDARLADHIEQQVAQIRAALDAAEKLEVQRLDSMRSLTESVRRELVLVQEAAARAIEKAESANEKRFESVNEFRAQLTEQTASFLPREVAESQFAELRRAITELTEKVGKIA